MKPHAFYDLPADSFPLRLQYLQWNTRAVVDEVTITGPGALEVPPLAEMFGSIGVRSIYPDGTVMETPPPDPPGLRMFKKKES